MFQYIVPHLFVFLRADPSDSPYQACTVAPSVSYLLQDSIFVLSETKRITTPQTTQRTILCKQVITNIVT